MRVIVAKSAGFCYGVRRALDTVLDVSKSAGKPMFTLGPLIHNPQVIERLTEQGVKPVGSLDEVPGGAVIVMPSHGVPRQTMDEAQRLGLEIIDVTCPFVGKVHKLAEGLVKDGYQIVVLGDKEHTEVGGILSVCGDDAIVVPDPGMLSEKKLKNRVGILAQTTQTVERYKHLVAEVAARVYEVQAYKTICNATMDRQTAALKVAAEVDIMLVVGGRNSANTRRLAEICMEAGVPAHHIEVADEIDECWFADVQAAGVTAGASTPDWIVNEVVKRLEAVTPSPNPEGVSGRGLG